MWELTEDRCTPNSFAHSSDHTVTKLRAWSDHELENTGRLTRPMKYDAATDRYEKIDWDTAGAGSHNLLCPALGCRRLRPASD